MQHTASITRTFEGRTYTLGRGTIALIATTRENARGKSGYDRVSRLTGLRDKVAETLGTDKRTAHYILRAIKLSDCYSR